MRKHIFGRQLSRDANERKALFRNLMSELVLHEKIQTTEQKAKAIKGKVEKLVTKAKKNDIHARVLISPYLTQEATDKILEQIAPRFSDRPGGYTRIIRLKRRLQDNASMVVIEWVEKSTQLRVESGELRNKKDKKDVDEVMADVVYGKEKNKEATSKTGDKKKTAKSIKKEGKSRLAKRDPASQDKKRSGSAREKKK